MPGGRNASVTTYWWLIGTIGTRTSTRRAISAAYMPPQSTTTSHSVKDSWPSPRSVRTPVTRPCSVVMPVTRVRWAIVTPPARAEPASAMHSMLGSTWPSVGV